MTINMVAVVGKFTRNEPKHNFFADSGKQVVKFSIAEYRGKNKATGESEFNFFDCEAWNLTAERLGKVYSAGGHVTVSGRLRHNPWKDENGKTHNDVLIVCDRIETPFVQDQATTQTAPAMAPPVAQAGYQVGVNAGVIQAAPAPSVIPPQQQDIF